MAGATENRQLGQQGFATLEEKDNNARNVDGLGLDAMAEEKGRGTVITKIKGRGSNGAG